MGPEGSSFSEVASDASDQMLGRLYGVVDGDRSKLFLPPSMGVTSLEKDRREDLEREWSWAFSKMVDNLSPAGVDIRFVGLSAEALCFPSRTLLRNDIFADAAQEGFRNAATGD